VDNLLGIENGAAMRHYFTNESDSRPSCHCSDGEVACDTVAGQLFSSDNVPANERPYKDILVLDNGAKFSMSDKECFEGAENYELLYMDIK